MVMYYIHNVVYKSSSLFTYFYFINYIIKETIIDIEYLIVAIVSIFFF